MKFKNLKIKKYIQDALVDLNFHQLTPIQEEVIPKALEGQSIVGKSPTGTGKTHCFLIPIANELRPNVKEVQAVIIVPTRELGQQIYDELKKITRYSPEYIDLRLYVGGGRRDDEIKRLELSQPQVVIGTIGKIEDLAFNENLLKIHTADKVVIDEADMVFVPEDINRIDQIFALFKKDIQSLVFSATITDELSRFVDKYLNKSVNIDLSGKKISKDSIKHVFIKTKNKDKNKVLLDLLKIMNPYLVLIFANTLEEVDDLSKFLGNNGYPNAKLDSSLKPRERKNVLSRIKKGEYQYVVASDLAARGMDITGVSLVVNYSLPVDIKYYTHRSGRTARFKDTGTVISLLDFDDEKYLGKLYSRGLDLYFGEIVEGMFKETKYQPRKKNKYDEEIEVLHVKYPMPPKVKPNYRKRRKEKIAKETKQIKRKRVEDIYKKKAKND
ncbi:MAG TPA: DEAD/DEAH box helicase [Acholeplasma sp.]|nr:DEAD/DEAH box helicase [Acholeplasma sp.]